MSVRLNARERETAIVAADLFSKGSPELRVAEYAHRKGFTDEQFYNLLEKLPLPEEVKFVIHTHFRDIARGDCYDKSRAYGKHLWAWGMSTPKTPKKPRA
jgi:hypothetical protein